MFAQKSYSCHSSPEDCPPQLNHEQPNLPQELNPLQVPLLNTAILLAPVVTVTWAHHCLLENNATQATQGLFFTVLLGIYFIALPTHENIESPFTVADSAYRSTSSVATGFHRLHIIIGTPFLITCLLWQTILCFWSNHDFGFKSSMILTFCRRSLIIWIHLNLLMRKIK
jgi:heme/copper-type cytochrome/quinol oxidase subunit 3